MISPQLSALLCAMTLAACSSSGFSGGSTLSGQALADQQTRAACRNRAEQIYAQQNRADIFAAPAAINSPSSGMYAPGQSDRGLSQRFVYERMVSDCIRNTGAAQNDVGPQPVNEPTPPPAPGKQ